MKWQGFYTLECLWWKLRGQVKKNPGPGIQPPEPWPNPPKQDFGSFGMFHEQPYWRD